MSEEKLHEISVRLYHIRNLLGSIRMWVIVLWITTVLLAIVGIVSCSMLSDIEA